MHLIKTLGSTSKVTFRHGGFLGNVDYFTYEYRSFAYTEIPLAHLYETISVATRVCDPVSPFFDQNLLHKV